MRGKIEIEFNGIFSVIWALCVVGCACCLQFLSHFTWLSYLALSSSAHSTTPDTAPEILQRRWATGSERGF